MLEKKKKKKRGAKPGQTTRHYQSWRICARGHGSGRCAPEADLILEKDRVAGRWFAGQGRPQTRGVSPGSGGPSHHFQTKTGLLDAMRPQGFFWTLLTSPWGRTRMGPNQKRRPTPNRAGSNASGVVRLCRLLASKTGTLIQLMCSARAKLGTCPANGLDFEKSGGKRGLMLVSRPARAAETVP